MKIKKLIDKIKYDKNSSLFKISANFLIKDKRDYCYVCIKTTKKNEKVSCNTCEMSKSLVEWYLPQVYERIKNFKEEKEAIVCNRKLLQEYLFSIFFTIDEMAGVHDAIHCIDMNTKYNCDFFSDMYLKKAKEYEKSPFRKLWIKGKLDLLNW